MRNVNRPPKPASLARNADKWTRVFLSETRKAKKSDKKVEGKHYDKYRASGVKEALVSMYNGLCCYCEARVDHIAFEEIEHRHPKRRFPERAFDWDNLHLACPKCNRGKSDRWDEKHPILDAVSDVPISDHLTYKSTRTGVRRVALTKRGTTTIEETSLNDEKKRNPRTEVFLRVVGLVMEINLFKKEDPDSALATSTIAELEEKRLGEYGSMIKWAMDSFLVKP